MGILCVASRLGTLITRSNTLHYDIGLCGPLLCTTAKERPQCRGPSVIGAIVRQPPTLGHMLKQSRARQRYSPTLACLAGAARLWWPPSMRTLNLCSIEGMMLQRTNAATVLQTYLAELSTACNARAVRTIG